jgi:hypothetical protein
MRKPDAETRALLVPFWARIDALAEGPVDARLAASLAS